MLVIIREGQLAWITILFEIYTEGLVHLLEAPEANRLISSRSGNHISHRVESNGCAFLLVNNNAMLYCCWDGQVVFF